MTLYKCKECDAKVTVEEGVIKRECTGHEDKGIIAQLDPVHLRGVSAIKQQ